MKYRTITSLFLLAFTASLALAQIEKASGLVTNDATQARLRVVDCVFGSPNVDLFINGEIAVAGTVPHANIESLVTWTWTFLTPGTYTVTVAPTGEGIETAMLDAVVVTVEAGHRYTFVVMGQLDEASHQALVIDETAAYQAIGKTPTDNAHIFVNNLRGVSGFSFSLNGTVLNEDVPFGGFDAAILPPGTFHSPAITDNATSRVMFSFPGYSEHLGFANDALYCAGGTQPGIHEVDWGQGFSNYTSSLNAVEYLKEQTRGSQAQGGELPTYEMFLSGLEAAGLTETFISGGPYLVYVPTDAAFERLPEDQLAALRADPQALADLVRYHIVERYGYAFPRPITITNLLGEEWEVTAGDTINGNHVERHILRSSLSDSFLRAIQVGNGTRLLPIDNMLRPPAP